MLDLKKFSSQICDIKNCTFSLAKAVFFGEAGAPCAVSTETNKFSCQSPIDFAVFSKVVSGPGFSTSI